MGVSLVIVESPAKAKTINKILGKDFIVKASVGHIKDLPSKKLGVDVKNDFESEYIVIPGKEKVIKELRAAAKKADTIYLAPDPDREGEAIAAHIASEVKGPKRQIFRVVFNEITAKAVREAVENPGEINQDRVDAQQARRVLDRLVGYNLSPLLWKKIRRGLSAGRVQSVAVRLVVDREREIEAFKEEEYWSIPVKAEGSIPPKFEAKLHQYGGEMVIKRDAKEGSKRFLITSQEQADAIAAELRAETFSLAKVDQKKRKRSPSPPFITSTLQQEASRKLGFTTKKTMMLAQQLYEGVELGSKGSTGLITYMRTDSVRIADEAKAWAKVYIAKTFDERYVPKAPKKFKSKASAQEAHEAIRPTYAENDPVSVRSFLSADQRKLYELIWNRFIASQMKDAELLQTSFDIVPGKADAMLRAAGTVIKFHGFLALYSESKDETSEEEEGILPALKEGDVISINEIAPNQHFTQPPPRFTEASLVKTLEENGIGRPSTYASIMSTIVDREYVEKDNKRFKPTELGTIVNDYLVENFGEILNSDFTAKMENLLDRIEVGKSKWKKVIKDFYKPFDKDLTAAAKAEGNAKPADIATDEKCEKCGKDMIIKWGRHGRFKACSGYPECKNTEPLEGERPQVEDVPTDEKCPKCDSPMVIKTGRFGKFIACSKYPDCKTTKPIPTGVICPLDGGDVVEKRTRKGKTFWSCGNYPKCTFATWHRPIAEACPKCGAGYLVIKKQRSGPVVKACENKECGHSEEYVPPEKTEE
ncbi:type I DNA topoisomerase [Nitrospirota bacterium]